MIVHPPIPNATDSPLPFALSGVPAKSKRGEGLGRRVEPVETVRSLTMFAAGVRTMEGLMVGEQVKHEVG